MNNAFAPVSGIVRTNGWVNGGASAISSGVALRPRRARRLFPTVNDAHAAEFRLLSLRQGVISGDHVGEAG